MKRCVVVLFLLIAVSANAQQGRPTNKNAWLKGTYSFIIHGTVYAVRSGTPHQAVMSGWLALDGAGHITDGTSSVTIDGSTMEMSVTTFFSDYSVDLNGYGKMQLMLASSPQHFILAVAHMGDSFYIHVKDVDLPNEVPQQYHFADMSGEAMKQAMN